MLFLAEEHTDFFLVRRETKKTKKKHFNSDCVVLIGCELTKGIYFVLSTFLQYTTNTKMLMVTFLKALMGEITCSRILELTNMQ